jgi:hypothetical protein
MGCIPVLKLGQMRCQPGAVEGWHVRIYGWWQGSNPAK